MEIVGGFMVMMSIIGFFLAVVWLVMPFVVFAIKGKQDRTLEVLEAIEKRLASLENDIQKVASEYSRTVTATVSESAPKSAESATLVVDSSGREESGTL